MLIVLFGAPLVFAALPVTLRRARVQARHIVRIWMYSLVGPALIAITWMIVLEVSRALSLDVLTTMLDPWRWGLHRLLPRDMRGDFYFRYWRSLLPRLVLLTIALLWALWWWSWACREYLRLSQARQVIGVLGVILTLAGLAAAVPAWLWPS